MINEIFASMKGDLLKQISGGSNLGGVSADQVTNVVTDSFKNGITDKFSSGGISEILGLFGKGGNSSPFAGSLVNDMVSNLISRLGLSQDLSKQIATIAVPFIIDKFGNYAKSEGKDNQAGIAELLGGALKDGLKDQLLGGLGKSFGF